MFNVCFKILVKDFAVRDSRIHSVYDYDVEAVTLLIVVLSFQVYIDVRTSLVHTMLVYLIYAI
jgi:indole-3-glycerol phosphate synthase